MSEKGAIHPCQMPENNPAVCVAEFDPSPGMQPVNEMHITVIIRNNINFLSVFIYFPPLSINGFRIVLIHTKLKYCQKQPPWEAICFLANDQRAPFSVGEIHCLRRPRRPGFPGRRLWSKLAVSSPERCPVCVKHIASHGGVLIATMYRPYLQNKPPPMKTCPIEAKDRSNYYIMIDRHIKELFYGIKVRLFT